MSDYLTKQGTRTTPQSQPMRADQVRNEAGGYVWEIDKWARLRRFLILGSEGGSYYASEFKATQENAAAVRSCLKEDGLRTVNEIVEISKGGRAPKNDPALFALACAISAEDKMTRSAAAEALPAVARIGTHLYHFVAYAETMRGWGRTMKWAIANWYNRNPEQLALQAIKYRQRDGWSYKDLQRLARFDSKELNEAARDVIGFISGNVNHQWVTDQGYDRSRIVEPWEPTEITPAYIEGFLAAQKAETPRWAAEIVRQYNLPREALKTEHLNSLEVWEALLFSGGKYGMPMTALIRNLATMTRIGLLKPGSLSTQKVNEMLDSQELLTHARIHPLAVLIGMETYAQGRGMRSQNTWKPVSSIVDALDGAFYKTFGNVKPTGKRLLIAVDGSGSMRRGQIAGAPGLMPVKAAMAQALVFTATERDVETIVFDTSYSSFPLSARQRLDDVVRRHPGHGRGTDVALPFVYAMNNNRDLDGFVVLSDFQTWAGHHHPAQALRKYREKTGIPARVANVALIANRWTTGEPEDPLAFEAIGFDTSTPELVSGFVTGEF